VLRKAVQFAVVLVVFVGLMAWDSIGTLGLPADRVREWDNPADQAEIAEELAKQEAEVAQAARKAFPDELKGWAYYPFWEKWRKGERFSSMDEYLAQMLMGWMDPGDRKPCVFVKDGKMAVFIDKANGEKWLILYEQTKAGTWKCLGVRKR